LVQVNYLFDIKGDQYITRDLRYFFIFYFRWLAGRVRDVGNLNIEQTISLITTKISEMYNIKNVGRIIVGEPANFVVFNDDPFEYTSYIRFIGLNKIQNRNPIQF
jgi:hypothetical protein